MATFIESNDNIFNLEVEALVNPVNCKGVSGAGLAKDFAQRFPNGQRSYERACKQTMLVPDATGTIRKVSSFLPGDLLAIPDINVQRIMLETINEKTLENLMNSKQTVIYFPTKNHWKRPSTYEYIEKGLKALVNLASSGEFKTIAIPALGCGLGGLDYEKVSIQIQEALKDTDLEIYMLHPLRVSVS